MVAIALIVSTTGVDPADKPNVVLILADDLGYGALGCYGQAKVSTPRIDRLAREGMRFTQAYAGCSYCAPSRCVLMTGKHGGHCRIRVNDDNLYLHDEDVSLAELFRPRGYATGVFGKWGPGNAGSPGDPLRQGFDTHFGYLSHVAAHRYYPTSLWRDGAELTIGANRDGARGAYSHDLIVDAALSFIRANRGRPFFCYLPVTIPHAELLVPEDSMKPYRGVFPETPFGGNRYAAQPTPRAAYAGMVSRLDRDVGRVVDLLKELDLDERTLVVFTSDNGPATAGGTDAEFFRNAGPLRGLKFSLWEGGIRVPLIARWPGTISAGATSDKILSFDDLFATLGDVAGAAMPAGIDGVSILPTLLGKPGQVERDYWYWEAHRRATGFSQAVRRGKWKCIRPSADAQTELYDLDADVGETTNRASEHPGILAALVEIMRAADQVP